MRARQVAQERLNEVFALPRVAKHFTMINPVSSSGRVMAIGVTSNKLSLVDMSVLARWTIQPRLLGVPGVANVSIWGRRERQLQVQVDPEKLRDHRVTLMQIIKTAGNALWASPLSFLEASTPGTGGWVETPNQRLGVRHVLPITTAKDLAKVPIDDAESKRLGDVASVVEDHQPLIGDAIVKDAPALMLVVEKFPWANTQAVTKGVEHALAALRPGLSGLEMDSSLFRPATFLDLAVGNLRKALLTGSVLVLAALLAFLFNWRTALISAVAILMSMTAAATVLYVRGVTVNLLIIAGLLVALAAVIDDAIVDTGNIVRRLRQHRKEGSDEPTARIILDASLEMRRPILYATLIMVLVVVPVLFVEGVSAAFWQPFAASYILALLASMVVALTVTPALSLLFLRDASLQSAESPVAGVLRDISGALFGWVARTPRTAFVALCAVVVAGLLAVPFLRQESLLPTLKETDLVVRWEGSSSASHPAMSRITTLVSRELRSVPGVRNVSANMGRAILSDKRKNINAGELWVSIDPKADYDATVAAVKEVVAGYPGLSPEVLTNLQAKLRQELSGTGESLVLRVYGEDMTIIRRKAQEVQKVLAGVAGVVDSKVQYPEEMPTLEIEVNLDRARGYGLKGFDFPLEYRAELLGEYAERLAAQERVLTFAIAAAIGILLLLQAFFRSWRLATVVFVTLPMALVGGALAVLSSAGGLLSLGSIVGLITVLGIAVRNAMTLVSRYRQLEQRDGAPVRPELVERGTRERSGPILMTAVTTALAFLPLALFGDIAGLEIMHPMAVVILGGLVTTTLLSLVGVPAMYLLFGAVREPELEDLSAAVVSEEAMRAAAR